MKKNYILVVDTEKYTVCDAIEDNAPIWWNNSKNRLKKR